MSEREDVTQSCQWFVPPPKGSPANRCYRCQQPAACHVGINEGLEIRWEHYVGVQPCGCERRSRGGPLHLCPYHEGWNDALERLDQTLDDLTEGIIGGATAAGWLRDRLDELEVSSPEKVFP